MLEASEFFPRGTTSRAYAGGGDNFWDLMAGWYAECLERLMRRGIVVDYVGRADALPYVRGRINGTRTALTYYQGRLDIDCEYEDFGQDTSLNRVLKAAGETITRSSNLSSALRKRTRAVLTRFEEVGALRPSDFRASTDRRTAHYQDAITLSRLILAGVHRVLSHGERLVWTFLIPTPVMIEEGVRRELTRSLEGDVSVVKRSFPVQGSSMRMNPDLVFGDVAAVGDVKYKLFSSGVSSRGDLNQVVTFAAAARTQHGIVVGFQRSVDQQLTRLGVGDIGISCLGWCVDPDLPPAIAADVLADQVRRCLLDSVNAASPDTVFV